MYLGALDATVCYSASTPVRLLPVGQADVEAAAGVTLGRLHHPVCSRPHAGRQQRQVPQHLNADPMPLYQAVLLHTVHAVKVELWPYNLNPYWQ